MAKTPQAWDVEDDAFWESEGKRVANRNLWISIPSLLLAFSVWLYRGMVAKFIQRLHFADLSVFSFTFTNDGRPHEGDAYRALLFTLPAVAAYGVFLIPKIFATQIEAGTPEYALYGFALYYASYLLVNWCLYARKGAERPCVGATKPERWLVAALVLACAWGCEPNNQGYAPSQPIKYSHAVHAGAMQINCQYCHYYARRSRHAGIPPAGICMNCHTLVQKDHPEIQKIVAAISAHEPIEWVKVHHLPDHVFFDHSVHVGAGLKCQKCHGPVESMGRVEQWAPLTMGWCIECHRKSSSPDGSEATVRVSALTDCVVCHH